MTFLSLVKGAMAILWETCAAPICSGSNSGEEAASVDMLDAVNLEETEEEREARLLHPDDSD